MKSSRYNFLFEVDGLKYAYNALSTAIVQIDDDVYEVLGNGHTANLPSACLNDLKQAGFIVESETDEASEYGYFFDSVRYGRSASVVHVTLLPTYGCNLACPYCAQGMAKTPDIISKNKTDVVLKFIEHLCSSDKDSVRPTKLLVSLFGGEPLLFRKGLPYFLEKCKVLAQQNSIPLLFDLTTNFTLCTPDVLDLVKKFNVNVQVSIDGTKEHHDKRRVHPNGNGTYDVILKNLEMARGIGLRDNITIRVNTDQETVKDAKKVYEELDKYAGYIYFSFLTSYRGMNEGYNGCVEEDCYADFMSATFNPIFEAAGKEKLRMFGKKAPCAMVCENKFWVDLNLDVYKCELLVKHPEMRAGYLDENGILVSTSGNALQMNCSPLQNEKCRECKLLPVCGGGCPAKKYINSTDQVLSPECSMSEAQLIKTLSAYIRQCQQNESR